MGTLGRTTRNGTKPGVRRVEPRERPHPAIAKLAVALKENKETLEQQAATADILRALSRSSSDPQPVFEAIVEHAHRLCGAVFSILYRYDGNVMTVAADRVNAKASRILRTLYPAPPRRDHIVGRALLEGRVVHSSDVPNDPRFPANRNAFMKVVPFRAGLEVPLFRNGAVVGAIAVGRLEAKAFTKKEIGLLKTFADQAVIAIENVRLFEEVQARTRELSEALERQTATTEVLNVISRSTSQLQPVLDAIVKTALRLCQAEWAVIRKLGEDGEYHVVANEGAHADFIQYLDRNPIRPSRGSVACRTVLERRTIHVPDVLADPEYTWSEAQKIGRLRTVLGVPLMREEKPIGVITLNRSEVRPFTESQIELVTTFADQAVIAIENVRLFNETKEALEQQTATSEILRVISNSPTEIQPVLDAVAATAARLCEARDAIIQLREGDVLRFAAHYGTIPNLPQGGTRAISRHMVTGRAVLEGRQIHVHDLQAEEKEFPQGSAVAKEFGYRTLLVTPLMREGKAIGTILIRRTEVRPFSDKHLALARTFADQAVIAIENVRLFRELEVRNKALGETLEQQTATAEILGVISSALTDVQPVFDAIIRSAVRLCGGLLGTVLRFDGKVIDLIAHHNLSPEGLETYRRVYPMPVSRDTVAGCALLDRAVVNLPDSQDTKVPPRSRAMAQASGFRSVLVVPMLREGQPIGVINVARAQPGLFSEAHVDLLKTFADQAVIAIENARLFNETKQALERQTATSDILRVISSSPTDIQPVFDAVVESAARLCDARTANVFRVEGDVMRKASQYGPVETTLALGQTRPITLGSVSGRAIIERRTVHVEDALAVVDTEYPEIRDTVRREGLKTVVGIPLLREGTPIGAITVYRTEARPFSDEHIALLQTFAHQAVIAIENVRLFNETKEALDHQKASADILRIVAGSVENIDPVFEAITAAGMRLVPGARVSLVLVKEEQLHYASHSGVPEQRRAYVAKFFPFPLKERRTVSSIAILEKRTLHIPDIEVAIKSLPTVQEMARASGYRAILCVPLLREGQAIGAISLTRDQPGAFSEKQVELAKTFADQAVIAIQNAKMFREIQDRNAELKQSLEFQGASGEILASLSSSVTDAGPVFDAINRNLLRLIGARSAAVMLVQEGKIHVPAALGDPGFERILERYPIPLDDRTVAGKAILLGEVVRLTPIAGNPAAPPTAEANARAFGYDSVISAPMIRDGKVIGAITASRREPIPFDDKQLALIKAFADQAVIAIENARLFNETKEALERQTATGEILRVIAGTPADAQPVFDAIAQSALRVFDVSHVGITVLEGDSIRSKATAGSADPRGEFVIPLNRDSTAGRSMLDKTVINIGDTEAPDAPSFARDSGRVVGFRAIAAAPMLREGTAIGSIHMMRKSPGPFNDAQIDLLKTFADQAVIAIENARLFNETKESLEQQTATAEILKVISSSPTATQPVFEAIVQSAARLFSPCNVAIIMRDGDLLHRKADAGPRVSQIDQDQLAKIYPLPFDPKRSIAARVLIERRIIEIPDTEAPGLPEIVAPIARAAGHRSVTAVPLIREGEGIGAIGLTHPEAGFRLTEKQLSLLRTFADQAVIAIENVRLFNELQTRNRALTEALEQQTATGEILKVISGSTSNVQPVYETIVRNAVRLCDGAYGMLFRFDGELMDIGAHYNFTPEVFAMFRRDLPVPASFETPSAHAILERTAINVGDIHESSYPEAVKERARALGWRSVLTVPMMRDDTPIGALAVTRRDPGAFSDSYVALLKTFAAQAVIAVENVRLFNEINEALRLQTSTADVLKTISRSTFDLDAVLQALLDNATRLSGAHRAVMLRPDAAGNYRPAVTFNYPVDSPVIARLREHPIRPGQDSTSGRVLLERKPIHIPDVLADPEYRRQDLAEVGGFRTALSVPMLRDGEAIGLITLTKGAEVDPFTDKQMELVTTFADQAVIAIENVRLFREIEEKSAQLEVANKHKSDFLANMSHELRTPLNAIIGFSEALMERMFGELNDKQADYLKDIHESGKHLLSLINDILDLSKIEAGRMDLEISSFHLPSALSNAMTLVRERAQRHGIELGLEVDPQLGELHADERKFKQIVLNLLSNAVKFTPDGGRVDVSARKFDAQIEVAVRDTGIGIAPEHQAAVFEEFKQVGGDPLRKAEGTGLGLALTKRFVELHGGAIRLESAPGKGSTFAFTLPVRQ